jgi:hypothetical protein
MDVPKDAMAMASVAQDHGAAVTDLGTIGTRQVDIDHLVCKRQPLVFVSEAGPCGYGLDRSLTQKG